MKVLCAFRQEDRAGAHSRTCPKGAEALVQCSLSILARHEVRHGVVAAYVIEASRTTYDFSTGHNFSSAGFQIGEKIRDALRTATPDRIDAHKIETASVRRLRRRARAKTLLSEVGRLSC